MVNKSRRRLLKALTVGGGAILAGGALPESWVRPIVEFGVLPAHAQISGPQYSVSNCTITRAEETGGATEVDFTFLVSVNPPAPIALGGTINYELTFQPSNTVQPMGGASVINAAGNGSLIAGGGGGGFPAPITGESSVSLRITEVDTGSGSVPFQSTCTTGPEAIT